MAEEHPLRLSGVHSSEGLLLVAPLRLWHKETNDLVAGELGGPSDLDESR